VTCLRQTTAWQASDPPTREASIFVDPPSSETPARQELRRDEPARQASDE